MQWEWATRSPNVFPIAGFKNINIFHGTFACGQPSSLKYISPPSLRVRYLIDANQNISQIDQGSLTDSHCGFQGFLQELAYDSVIYDIELQSFAILNSEVKGGTLIMVLSTWLKLTMLHVLRYSTAFIWSVVQCCSMR